MSGSVSGASYTLALGLSFIAFVLTFGVGSVSGAVAASLGAVQGVIIYAVNLVVHVSTNLQLIIGGVMLIFTIMYHPDGITVDKAPPSNALVALLRRARTREAL